MLNCSSYTGASLTKWRPATTTIGYSQGSCRSFGHLSGLVSPERSGESEIGDLGSHVGTQQDVAGLEVPVDDPQPGLLVEVLQAARDPADDRVSLAPVQSLLLLLPSPCITQRRKDPSGIQLQLQLMCRAMQWRVQRTGYRKGWCPGSDLAGTRTRSASPFPPGKPQEAGRGSCVSAWRRESARFLARGSPARSPWRAFLLQRVVHPEACPANTQRCKLLVSLRQRTAEDRAYELKVGSD